LIIGVPKETKTDERRVALQPYQVKILSGEENVILIEGNAGKAAGFPDSEYESCGAKIVHKETIYSDAQLILKVKCPLPEEVPYLRPGKMLFAYLHFDENISPHSILEIAQTGITALAYEWVCEDNHYPLLKPMSELTGCLYAVRSIELLAKHKGKIAGGYLSDIEPAHCLIIGLGNIGKNALKVCLMNNLSVDVVDKNPNEVDLKIADYITPYLGDLKKKIEVIAFDQNRPDEAIGEIDRRIHLYDIVLNCAVRRPDFPKSKCEYIISRSMVRKMQENSILCDATACDKDFIETSVSSEHLLYTYQDEGVIHYSCDHIPSYVPHTATKLLTQETFPYVKKLSKGFIKAIHESPALYKSVMAFNGNFTHELSAKKKALDFYPLCDLL